MSTNDEDQARQGFESGRSDYQVNYPFIYPSAEAVGGDFQKKIGWARYPRTDADEPSRPPLGGINIGVSAYSNKPDLAFEAAECLAQRGAPGDRRREGRPAADHRVGLRHPAGARRRTRSPTCCASRSRRPRRAR